MRPIAIGPAAPGDIDAVEALLEQEHLPLAGLRDHFDHALVARDGCRVIGCAALEVYEDGALLRSVTVDEAHRGTGVGTDLTRAAMDMAEQQGVQAIYLLTTTAQQFFPRFGFEAVDRAEVPPGISSSAEFSYACPSSATIMRIQMNVTSSR